MRNGDNNTPRNIDDGNPYSPSQGASLTRLYRICGFVFFISFGISVALYFHFRYADKSFELENIHTLSSSSSSMRPPTKTKTATTEEISKQNHVTESTSTRDDTFTCETTDGTTITMPRNVPDFLIIGTPKAGTLALREFFDKLPLFKGSYRKEPHFFDRKMDWMTPPFSASNATSSQVCEARQKYLAEEFYYHSKFPKQNNDKHVRFEKTPSYLKFGATGARRVYRTLVEPDNPQVLTTNDVPPGISMTTSTDGSVSTIAIHRQTTLVPDLKLIVCLRNPVDRAYSAYKMYLRFTRQRRSLLKSLTFEKWIEKEIDMLRDYNLTSAPPLDDFDYDPEDMGEDRSFFDIPSTFAERAVLDSRGVAVHLIHGLYSMHLSQWLQYFPKENIKAVKFETFVTNQTETMKDLLDFLGYPEQKKYLPSQETLAEAVKSPDVHGTKVQGMSPRTRAYLHKLFRPYNAELAPLLGDEWNDVWER